MASSPDNEPPQGYSNFLQAFIATYRKHPVLWDHTHPDYRSKQDRHNAITEILTTAQLFYPKADRDFVRSKIDSMRSSFRRERCRLRKRKLKQPECEPKPTLWYYDLLRFLEHQKEDCEGAPDEEVVVTSSDPRANFWIRERTAILINFYKDYPCLYSPLHPWFPIQSKRLDALKSLAEKLKVATGQEVEVEDVRRKIYLLRKEFFEEYAKLKSGGNDVKNTSWNFELLSFLKSDIDVFDGNQDDNFMSGIESEGCVKNELTFEAVLNEAPENKQDNEEDIHDTIGKNLAYKLRQMNGDQRELADKLIREVMYYGLMEQLSQTSKFSLHGT